jgi:hypothetical protein
LDSIPLNEIENAVSSFQKRVRNNQFLANFVDVFLIPVISFCKASKIELLLTVVLLSCASYLSTA